MLNFLKKDELAQIEQKTIAITELRKINTDLEQTVSRLSQDLEELKNTQAKERKKNAEFIGDLEEAKQKQEHDLANAKQTIRNLEVSLEKQQTKLEGANKKLELELTETKQKLHDLEKNILDQQTKINRMVPEAKLDKALSQLEQLRRDREEVVKDRQRLWEEYQKLTEYKNAWKDKAEKLEKDFYSLNEQIPSLQSEVSTDKKYILRNESLLKENHFLLIQLRQAHDELRNVQESYQKLQNQNDSISLKWKRLEKRLPNYIDYGGLELVKVDTVGLAPQILWKVTDYSRGDLALPEFFFVTTFHDGNVGITLHNTIADSNVGNMHRVFIPSNAETSIEQREIFFEFTQSEWEKVLAAGAVLEQLLVGTYPLSGNGTQEFDISFWRSSLQTLVLGIKKLPLIFRYESIKLKRELIHADYEHLWLEIYGIKFANQKLDKFEMRIGASLIEPNGFSRFPKFEIPLVDGRIQPFKSWFAESHDDQGPKFELRFSLDKSIFDLATWSKLSKEDQNLLQNLLFRIPIILNALSKENVPIRRPWGQWISFVSAALAVMKKQAVQLQKNESDIKESKQNKLSSLGTKAKQEDNPILQNGTKSSVTIVSSTSKNKNSRIKKSEIVKKNTKKSLVR